MFSFLPELVLFGGLVVGILSEVISARLSWGRLFADHWRLYILGLLGLVFFLEILSLWQGDYRVHLGGLFLLSPYGQGAKIVVLGMGILCFFLTHYYERHIFSFSFPYYAMMVTSLGGGLICLSANNILTLYVGIEIQSLPLYVMAGAKAHKEESLESAIRYFFVGSLGTIFLLMGSLMLYRAGGSLLFSDMDTVFSAAAGNLNARMGLVFFLLSFFLKMGIAPFHSWLPTTYSQAPTPAMIFFLLVSKTAFFLVLIRILTMDLAHLRGVWDPVLRIAAGLSLLVGAAAGIRQKGLKSLWAWASIATSGFIFLPIALVGPQGIGLAVSYLILYNLAMFVIFSVFLSLYRMRAGQLTEDSYKKKLLFVLEDLRGLWHGHKQEALMLTVASFGLAGLPPLGSFMLKANVFILLYQQKAWVLLGITTVTVCLGFGYYLRLVYFCFSYPPSEEGTVFSSFRGSFRFGSLLCAAGLILCFFVPFLWQDFVNNLLSLL